MQCALWKEGNKHSACAFNFKQVGNCEIKAECVFWYLNRKANIFCGYKHLYFIGTTLESWDVSSRLTAGKRTSRMQTTFSTSGITSLLAKGRWTTEKDGHFLEVREASWKTAATWKQLYWLGCLVPCLSVWRQEAGIQATALKNLSWYHS